MESSVARSRPIHLRDRQPLIAGIHRHEVDGRWKVQRVHGTDDWQLICSLSGRGRIVYSDGSCVLNSGGLALWPPGVAQDYSADDPGPGWSYAWVHFHPPLGWRALLDWPRPRHGPGLLQVDDAAATAIATRCQQLVQLAQSGGRRHLERALNALEDVLLQAEAWNPRAGQPPDPAIERVCEALAANPARPWRLDGLARLAGLSRAQFTRRFRAYCGSSPRAHLEQLRLARAAFLLASGGRRVGEIAEQLGFCSPFHFATRFRARYGVAPSQWRGYPRQKTELVAEATKILSAVPKRVKATDPGARPVAAPPGTGTGLVGPS